MKIDLFMYVCKFRYPNGDTYDGEYLKGKRNGKGRYTYSNGDKYEGEFRENRKHGIGKATY